MFHEGREGEERGKGGGGEGEGRGKGGEGEEGYIVWISVDHVMVIFS